MLKHCTVKHTTGMLKHCTVKHTTGMLKHCTVKHTTGHHVPVPAVAAVRATLLASASSGVAMAYIAVVW